MNNAVKNGSKAISAREKILTTAHALFYLHGIRATGIDKIIEQAGVTKVTFYRHFPSKNQLIFAYLDYRHTLWMTWFSDTLQHQSEAGQAPATALVATMRLWWEQPDFRGCAFLNATAEIGDALPEVEQLTREHKAAVAAELAGRWPGHETAAVVVALDGAIMHAQMGLPVEAVAAQLAQLLNALLPAVNRSA